MIARRLGMQLKYLKERMFGMKPTKAKLGLIDKALSMTKVDAFADLGGVWGVDGSYSFYILSKYNLL